MNSKYDKFKEIHTSHIIIKLQKPKSKNVLKAREKQNLMYKGPLIRLEADNSSETTEAKSQ